MSLQQMVDASFDAMFSIDEHGTILMVNAVACELFQYSRDEFVGHNIKMICGGGHAEHHDQYLENYLKTGVSKIMGKKREVPARKSDGSEFPVELGIKEIHVDEAGDKRFFCAFIKDLTEQKKHEKELKLQASVTQAVVNSSFDPMFEIDERGIIRMVNQSAVAMFGYSEEEFIGSNVSMICGEGHAAKHDQYMQRYLKTGEKHIIGRKRPTVAKRKDGSEFEVELGVQEAISDTGERFFCGYMRDLTRQKMDSRRMRQQDRLIQTGFFGDKSPHASAPSSPRSPSSRHSLDRKGSNASEEGGKRRSRPNRPLHHAHTTGHSM